MSNIKDNSQEQYTRITPEMAQYLLHCLDFMDHAICIYDKKNNFLYGNTSYCKTMRILDRDAAIGKNAVDILKQADVKLHYKKPPSDRFKMFDVLRTGKKALDWEIMIEPQNSSNEIQYIYNNIYPIKDDNDNTEGVIETFHSQRLNLNTTKKMIGLTAEYTFDSILGESSSIKNRIEQAKEYALSDHNVLIYGESGVGKELFAQAIHNYSARRNGPFVALNCANFPENLIESELFGYVSGAFTGASKNGQMGKFELADGGTLFLDEIGELPYHFQAKLLRVLETQRITRIGSSSETNINVRVIAATNRSLENMIDEGLFRKDLYYRLQVLSIEIPPLRDREDDILLLANAFLSEASESDGENLKVLDPDACKALLAYNWPGNVRELRNVIHRVTLLSKSNAITSDILNNAIYSKGYTIKPPVNDDPDLKLNKCLDAVNHAYADLINTALEIAHGNKKNAAQLLGMSRQTFYRMLEKYCK